MKKNIKGSAILVVIFSAIAFFIYAMSVYSETEHYSIIQNKYNTRFKEIYNYDKDEFYERTLENLND